MSQKDPINPSYYKSALRIPADRVPEFLDKEGNLTLQWIEKMEFTLTPDQFQGLLLGMSDKYTTRLGKKDESAQELGKGIWYLTYLKNLFARE